MALKKIAIVTTHPIQYYAPWFKLLAERNKVEPVVFYTWSQAENGVQDKDFGKTIHWDVRLTEGYRHYFVNNTSKSPGSHHRKGIVNPTLIHEIEKENPDAILIFGWNFISHWEVMKYFKKRVPLWFRGDSTVIDPMPFWKKMLRRIYLSRVYSIVDTVFYVGRANKQYFQWVGLQEEQLKFAPHAIDNERFYVDQFDIEAQKWRDQLGYTKEDIVLIYTGKLIPKKGVIELIKGVQHINQSADLRLKLLIIGDGVQAEMIDHVALKDSNIKRLPFQNQSKMPLIYRLGDVFCLPSKGPGETWGLAVNEAMASGRPVLVSDRVGCAWDLVETGKTGYVFCAGNEEDLQFKLEQIANNKAHLREMGLNSRQKIAEWSFLHICQSIESVF